MSVLLQNNVATISHTVILCNFFLLYMNNNCSFCDEFKNLCVDFAFVCLYVLSGPYMMSLCVCYVLGFWLVFIVFVIWAV